MINKRLLVLLASAVFACFSANAQMTDEAVITYITKGLAEGKTQSQIGRELLERGVTENQVRKLMQLSKNREMVNDWAEETKFGDRPEDDRYDRDSRSLSDMEKNGKVKNGRMDRDTTQVSPEERIYGHDLFANDKLTFEPNLNSAVPESYVLGPGDEVIIDVWGVNEATIKKKISAEGRIYVSQVGPIQLAGLSMEEATSRIRKSLSGKYSLGGDSSASQISVTLGTIRTIQVNVVGEVNVPGTYRLSSFSTVFSAIYHAGGVTEIGSLRNIQISRGGKVVQTADVYQLLFRGGKEGNIHLQDGDAIIVPAYSAMVKTTGGVKRPMFYEIKPGEPLSNILEYSGGFKSNAYVNEVAVQRMDGTAGHVYSVGSSQFAAFGMQDGDTVVVYSNKQKEIYSNRIQIKGAVARPGIYELGMEIATVRQLVEHAGGLLDDAFLSRAQIVREKPDRTLTLLAVPVGAIMKGAAEDILLQKNDVLIVSDNREIEEKGDVSITGFVKNPGDYSFAEGMTVEDLILLAGGFEEGASPINVEISRRIIDKTAVESSDTLAKIFTMGVPDDLQLSDTPAFCLEPYDVVSVRKSPTYVEQKRVIVSGEMVFPGEYTLAANEERISDMYRRAGGANRSAYVGGATLIRKVTDAERNVRNHMLEIFKSDTSRTDSMMLRKAMKEEKYTVGINLAEAIAHPGSDCDLILADGDELIVPPMVNAVSVQGAVLYPNSVSFIPGKSLQYYINQAGGFSNEAKRSKVYVVYMNGEVAVGSCSEVKAGCEIMVPKRPERQKASLAELISIGSSSASIIAVVANTIISMNR